MICRARHVIAILLIAFSPAIKTANYFGSETSIDFQPSAVTQNLTQQIVTQTFQDSVGNLWFVTQEGLNRYNGHELENYRYSLTNPHSLSHDAATSIAEDGSGTIWISTRGGGLNRYSRIKNGFSSLLASENDKTSPLSNDILTIFADRDGDLWLGYDNAFSKFDPNTGYFVHFFPQQEGLPYLGEINSFTQSKDGTIWGATLAGGLLKIDKATMAMSVSATSDNDILSAPSEPIFQVYSDSNGQIWSLSLNSGVTKYNPKTNTSKRYLHTEDDLGSLSSNNALDIFEDKDGRLWICTLDGLNLYTPESNSFERFNSQNTNLPSSRIYSIYQSKEGVYWVGTVVGLATGSRNLFPKYNSSIGQLSNDSVNAFGETEDGSIWVGTDNGLNRLKRGDRSFTWINEYSDPAISNSVVMSLLGEKNVLWIGTFSGGLNRLDITKNEVKVFKSSRLDKNSLAANGVTSIMRASSGLLLIGTYGGGLSSLDEATGKFNNYSHDPTNSKSLSNNNVIALFEDSFGFIWVGTENGLNRFDAKKSEFKRIYTERGNTDSVSSDMVWSFYEDNNQDLWLGTKGGGLNRWGKNDRKNGFEKFIHYSEDIALPSSNIYGIHSDPDGNIWLSHNRGVTKLNPKTGESRQYGVKEGLQDTEFNMGASFKDSDGLIYFGGNLGFNIVDPNGFVDKEEPPGISISEIKIMNERQEFEKAYNELSDITLTHRDSMFSVEFFAADYSNPPLVQYAYKMEGINDKWVISEDARQASFTTLPPGKYNLKLAAASPGGAWNWDSKSLEITVLPPPWRSMPAYFVYSLLIVAVIATYIYQQQARTRAGLARQRDLELKVQERTIDLEDARRAAVQASKAKSDFLATMSHEIRTPMHGMIGMTELLLHTDLTTQQRKFAAAAHKSGTALLALINDILDFSKIEASRVELETTPFDLAALIEDACYLQGEPAARKGLELNHTVFRSVPAKLLGDPGKIRQILMNLLNNAIKFTHEGEINVLVDYQYDEITKEGKAKINIIDSGIGMDEATANRVFEPFTQADASTTRQYGGTGLGLSITRNYIELMGGDIDVSSQPGHGTEIRISIPVSEAMDSDEPSNPLRLDGYNVSIISSRKSTRMMVRSQLERMGYLNPLEYEDVAILGETDQNDILIIDIENTSLSAEHVDEGLIKSPSILLMPIHEAKLTSHLSRGPTITKPCTSEALRLALDEITKFENIDDESSRISATSDNIHSLRVLVAEDIPTNQRIAQEVLEMIGHKVDIAENGKEAVELQKRNRYDIIFMDCQMPIMDGYQATRHIREDEHDRELKPVIIIALTAGITADDKRYFLDAGMDGYLGKPFRMSEIKDIIEEYFGITNSVTSLQPLNSDRKNHQSDQTRDSSEDLIDFSAINNITQIERQTGKSILSEVYAGFVSQMSVKIRELENASICGNDKEAQSIAHAIKSMSANLGAKQVKAIADNIEFELKNKNKIDLEARCIELEGAFNKYKKEFSNVYETRSSSETS